MGQWLLGGCHGNLGIDGDSLPGLTSDHAYDGSSESVRKGHISFILKG